MPRVQLIHWNASEAKERAGRIRAAGFEAAYEMPQGLNLFRKLRDDPPVAVVIDLSRLPMQGRDNALALRHYKTTRYLPIVFIEGDSDKVARIKDKVPAAVYTTWTKIRSALKQAITHPPQAPVVPKSLLDGYAGQPLAKKLGIKTNTVVALVAAPPGFKKILGKLPNGVRVREKARGKCDIMLWFVRSRNDLKRCVECMATRSDFGSLWIVWPKKTSGLRSDLAQQVVREAGLAKGLVDYRICAIDATWYGLLFTRRKAQKNV